MIGQAWIDRLMATADEDDPSTIGRSADDDARDAWALRFVARLVEVGMPIREAVALYRAGTYDMSEDPDAAATGELDAMSDGDLA